jgi:hypothetical protein
VTISAVGECMELNLAGRRMRGMKLSDVGEGA